MLLVSHSMFMVQRLCQRAIWIQEGGIRASGDVFDVTQKYLAWHEACSARDKASNQPIAGTNGAYRVESLELGDKGSQTSFCMGEDLSVEMTLYSPDGRVPVGLVGIVRAEGTPIYGVGSDLSTIKPRRLDEHRYRYRLRFRELPLLPGSYSVRAHAMDPEGLRLFDTLEQSFRVTGESRELGFLRLPHDWES
jgi:lipopolysaccharide transport system ATP-binding protein